MKTRLLTGAMALALIGCSEKSSETLREAPAYDMAPVETAEVAPQTPSAARSANIGSEIARLEARLKQGGLGDRERTELQQQISAMRRQLDGERDTRRAGEAMLATTPMQFDYVGTGGLPGIGYGNPFSDALNMLIRSGSVMLSFILVVGAAIIPWAALFLLLLMLWRTAPMRAIRKWLRGASKSSAVPAAPTD